MQKPTNSQWRILKDRIGASQLAQYQKPAAGLYISSIFFYCLVTVPCSPAVQPQGYWAMDQHGKTDPVKTDTISIQNKHNKKHVLTSSRPMSSVLMHDVTSSRLLTELGWDYCTPSNADSTIFLYFEKKMFHQVFFPSPTTETWALSLERWRSFCEAGP